MKEIFNMMVVLMVCISSMFFISINSQAYEDERVFVEEYISWMNEDGSWTEWLACTAENRDERFSLTFKVGQPLKVKIIVISQIKCVGGLTITEIGQHAYDIIEGNEHRKDVIFTTVSPETNITKLEELGGYGEILFPGEEFESIWVVQPNDRYAGSGWSRVSLDYFWEIDFYDVDEKGQGKITDEIQGIASFFNAYIRDEWTGPSYTPSNGQTTENDESTNDSTPSSSIPGFTLPALFLSLIGVSYFIKKKKKN
jgi:hypothetical protein